MSSPSDFQPRESALPGDHSVAATPPSLCSSDFSDFNYVQNQSFNQNPPFFHNLPYAQYGSMYPMNAMNSMFMTPPPYVAAPQLYGMPGVSSTVFSSPESLADSTLSADPSTPAQLPQTTFNNAFPAPADNSGITVTVADTKLWEDFDGVGNEMVLTKNGRNPFPKFHLKIWNLNSNEYYKVALSFDRSDDQRYKFNEGQMESCGGGEPKQSSEKVFHPDAINSGAHWMQNAVKFDKIKISNSFSDPSKPCVRFLVKLLSMHKYHAVAHIYRIEGYNPALPPHMNTETLIASVAIPHTTFVTVTAYQNTGVVALKVKYNNYARGFREDGKHTKRKNNEVVDEPIAKRNHNDSNDSGMSLSPQMASWPVGAYQPLPFSSMHYPPTAAHNSYPMMWPHM